MLKLLARIGCVVSIAGLIACALAGVVFAILIVWADTNEQAHYYNKFMMTDLIVAMVFLPGMALSGFAFRKD